jgi:hypothetical protein
MRHFSKWSPLTPGHMSMHSYYNSVLHGVQIYSMIQLGSILHYWFYIKDCLVFCLEVTKQYSLQVITCNYTPPLFLPLGLVLVITDFLIQFTFMYWRCQSNNFFLKQSINCKIYLVVSLKLTDLASLIIHSIVSVNDLIFFNFP